MVDIPVIPPSPPAPARAQAPDTFSQMADAFAAYIELMPGYYNALASALEDLAADIANQGFTATSTTSMTIGTGAKSLVASTGAAFISGQAVLISANGNPGNDMTATIVAYNSVDGAMDVDVTSVNGSGTYNDWALALTLSVDLSGYLQKAGGVMSGPLALPASTSAGATLNVPQGVAPSSPVNGDIWTTSTGIFARIATVTRQLASISGTETFTNKTLTSPVIDTATVNGPTINGYTEGYDAPSSGTAFSPNLSADTLFYYQTSGNATITLPAPAMGKSGLIVLEYGGAHTIAWAGGARKWVNGEVLVPTSVAGKIDLVSIVADRTGANWIMVPGGQNI